MNKRLRGQSRDQYYGNFRIKVSEGAGERHDGRVCHDHITDDKVCGILRQYVQRGKSVQCRVYGVSMFGECCADDKKKILVIVNYQ